MTQSGARYAFANLGLFVASALVGALLHVLLVLPFGLLDARGPLALFVLGSAIAEGASIVTLGLPLAGILLFALRDVRGDSSTARRTALLGALACGIAWLLIFLSPQLLSGRLFIPNPLGLGALLPWLIWGGVFRFRSPWIPIRWRAIPRRPVAAIGVVLVVLSFAASGWAIANPERHADGAGPLGSLDRLGGPTITVMPTGQATRWSFGVSLCLASGTEAAVIDSVDPTATIGDGFQSIGALIWQFTPSTSYRPITVVEDFPPQTGAVSASLGDDFLGARVSNPCTNDPNAPVTELLIGIEVGVDPADGGGWQGVDVGYTVAGRHRILAINRNLLICGTSTVAECSAPATPTGS